MANNASHTTVCSRCGDILEIFSQRIATYTVRLSPEESTFIRAKFNGALCAACLNQLKTSYKILNGGFDKPYTLNH